MTRHKHSCGHVHDCEAPYPAAAACPVTGDAAMELLALCDRLDQARAAGTSGPWDQDRDAIYAAKSTGIVQCETRDDAALIVAAVNSLPELTAAVRRLLADRQAVQRVEELAEEAATKGAALRDVAELRLVGNAYTGMADRIRRALGTTS